MINILFVARATDELNSFAELLQGEDRKITKISTCVRGKQALDADPNIDVVFVDADSADDCGFKLLHSVRSDQRISMIPVIMVGKNHSQDRVLQYHRDGAFDIVSLPTTKVNLDAKLARAIAQGKRTVLVVDDDDAIADFLGTFLNMERYRSFTANSGEAALEILKHQIVHAVISDIMMPGMNGLELLVEIKSRRPDIPVILITGYSGAYTPKDVISAGADGFFSKPFNNKELIYTLRSVLSRYPVQGKLKGSVQDTGNAASGAPTARS